MFASEVVDNMLAKRSNGSAPLAYYYCADRRSEKGVNAKEIMRSILRQIAVDEDATREKVLCEYELREAETDARISTVSPPSLDDCMSMITELLHDDPAMIVIDAIDAIGESERFALLQALTELICRSDNVLKIFLTSEENSPAVSLLTEAQNIGTSSHFDKAYTEFFVKSADSTISRALLPSGGSTTLETSLGNELVPGADGGLAARIASRPCCDAIIASLEDESDELTITLLESKCEIAYEVDYNPIDRKALVAEHSETVEGLRENFLGSAKLDLKKAVAIKAIISGHAGVLRCLLQEASAQELLPEDSVALAAIHGHAAVTLICLEHGLSTEKEGRFGRSLRVASLMGRETFVRLLLDQGAMVNASSPFGDALQASAMKGHAHVTTTLIAHGASVNQQCGPWGTALQAASYHGHLDVVKILLDAGASFSLAGKCRDAFYAAAEGGHADILSLFLERGFQFAGPDFLCVYPSTPRLYKSLLRERSREARYGRQKELHEEPPPEAFITAYKDILLYRTRRADPRLVDPARAAEEHQRGQHRRRRGRRRLRHDPYGPFWHDMFVDQYALEVAAENGHVDVVRLLLERFEILGIEFKEIRSGLKLAAKNGHLKVLALMYDCALKNVIGQHEGVEALEEAVGHMQSEIVSFLLSKINMEEVSIEDHQKLLVSACRGSIDMFEKMWELARHRSSDAEVYNLQNAVFEEAAANNQSAIMQLMLGSSGQRVEDDTVHEAFRRAVRRGAADSITIILECAGNTPRLQDSHKEIVASEHSNDCSRSGSASSDYHERTVSLVDEAIIVTARDGQEALLRLLLDQRRSGVDFTTTVARALVAASRNGHLEIARHLIQERVDVNMIVEDVRTSFAETGREEWDITLRPPRKINALQACLDGFARRFTTDGKPIIEWLDITKEDLDAHETTMKLLLANGAAVNALGGCTHYPLYIATKKCSVKIVKMLMDAGADVNTKHQPKRSAEGLSDCSPEAADSAEGIAEASELDRGKERGSSIDEVETALVAATQRETSTATLVSNLLHAGAAIEPDVTKLLKNCLRFFGAGSEADEDQGRFCLVESLSDILEDGPGAAIRTLLLCSTTEKAEAEECQLLMQIAAAVGDISYIKLLLARGIEVNGTGYYYGTALQAASRFGHLEVVQALFEAGANPNILSGRHQTALRAAVSGCHVQVVELLLKRGANIYLLSTDESLTWMGKNTCLSLAVQDANSEILGMLLDAGADVTSDAQDRLPLLTSACGTGGINKVRLLLDAGANANVDGRLQPGIIARRDAGPLQMAISRGHIDIVRLLLERGANVNKKLKDEYPLALAAEQGSLEILRLLIEAGAGDDDKCCNAAMNCACARGHLRIVKELMSNDKVNLSLDPYEPLQHACKARHYTLVSYALERLCALDIDDWHTAMCAIMAASTSDRRLFEVLFDYCPRNVETLFLACMAGSERAIASVLRSGISVNEVQSHSDRPLHVAASHMHLFAVRVLLDHGADVNLVSQKYGSPVMAVLEGCLALQLEAQYEPQDAKDLGKKLPLSASQNRLNGIQWLGQERPGSKYTRNSQCLEIIQMLVKAGTKLRTDMKSFGSALHISAFLGMVPVAQLLLDNGANINEKGGYFETALYAAIEGNQTTMAELLLRKGIEVDHVSARFDSPLQYACYRKRPRIIPLLLEYGADPCKKGRNGASPLSMALDQPDWQWPSHSLRDTCLGGLLYHSGALRVSEEDLAKVDKASKSQKATEVKARLLQLNQTVTIPAESSRWMSRFPNRIWRSLTENTADVSASKPL